jgi:hypothetical protein
MCAINIFARESFFGGVFHEIDHRLRNVGVVGPLSGGLSKMVTRCGGDLAHFVWLAWAGLGATPKSGGDVFYRQVELGSKALSVYRASTGKVVVLGGLSSWTSRAASAQKSATPARGGVSVMFRLRTRGLPGVGGSFLLPPFARLVVEAVDGNIVSVAESGVDGPRLGRTFVLRPALSLPPGMRPGVVPLSGACTKLHEAARRGDLRVIRSFAKRPEFINARDAKGFTPAVFATVQGQAAAVRELALLGAEFAFEDLDGMTLMHAAAESDQGEVIRVLYSLGANVNTAGKDGMTPVFHAARSLFASR